MTEKRPNEINEFSDSSLETDDLITDILRRKSFDSLLSKEFRTASKDNPLAVVMIDIDHFKRVNDTYGHQQGDKVLKEIGKILSNVCDGRKGYAARYGGEELALILPNFTFQEAEAVAERARSAIEKYSFQLNGKEDFINCTVSIGISVYSDAGAQTKKELISQTDKALYKAKKNGRNQVCLADGTVMTSENIQQHSSLEVEFIPDGSRCYLLQNRQLLLVVHLKFINRSDTPTTVQLKTVDIQINTSWEKAERAKHSPNNSIQELRGNISVRNQDWLKPHDDTRLDARDTQTAYVPFLLQKKVTSDIEEVQVRGIVEGIDGRSAKFEAIIQRYR